MEETLEAVRSRPRHPARVRNAPNIMTTVCVLSAGLVTIIGWLVMETMKLQKQVERIAYMLSRKSTEAPMAREASPPRPQTTAASLLNAIAGSGGSILSMTASEKPATAFTQSSIIVEEEEDEEDDDDDDDDDDGHDETDKLPSAPALPATEAGVRETSEESKKEDEPPRSRKKKSSPS